ncbi:hypothetical protein [Vibrio taketomensis]|uniref:hypothetical protein n=1 Tax=Vibrio taketomensis TaxID=2572923 RepID=UPI0013897413|nr:hypothetical protein [Vibrio taketomensis]
MSNRNAVSNHLIGMLIWPLIGALSILIIQPSAWAFMSLFTAIPTFGFIAIYSGQAVVHRDLISILFSLLWVVIFCLPLIYRWRFEESKIITYFRGAILLPIA